MKVFEGNCSQEEKVLTGRFKGTYRSEEAYREVEMFLDTREFQGD